MEKKDGGPAFPHLHESCQRINESEQYGGISLRDYFAAAVAGDIYTAARTDAKWDELAKDAYDFADAMLGAREK